MRKKKIILISFLIFCISIFCACANDDKMISNEETVAIENSKSNDNIMEDFSCETNKGNVFTLNGRSKPAFINFWATWCGPCRMEMPDLQNIYEEYKDKVDFIFVNCGDSKEIVDSFIENSDTYYTFPIGYDESDELAYKYNITGIPTTYIVDKNNVISDVVVGAREGADYKKLIDKVLGK